MQDTAKPAPVQNAIEATASSPWTDLGLTLPVFIAYHLGVVLLPVRNAADWMTRELTELSDHDPKLYTLLTVCVGVAYAGTLFALGRGHALRAGAFLWLIVEAAIYAIAMRALAMYVVGEVFLGPVPVSSAVPFGNEFAGLVLSFGAGFYEELAFRVGLYGLGYRLILILFPMSPWHRVATKVGWAVLTALAFSLWHYVGALGDPFEPRSFVFRWVCGLVFCLIFEFRGFAPAVWTHVLYDIWVLVV
jgi:hypothetical protein